MTSAHEPVLHALSVEPRVARPGESVCVIFRTRNLGTSASPPGAVTFLLGDGLQALDELEVAVQSVAPGEDVVAMVRARIAVPLDDRTELTVQAALRAAGVVLGTNVCTVSVRSRAILDGPASGTFVEPVDADRVRVRAIVANEGDGAARDVRVDVPAPAGCVRADGDGPAVLELERLEAGASVSVAFEARIVEPIAVLTADDGAVRFATGQRRMLPAREVVVMEPLIAAPRVTVTPSRRSVDIAVDVRNDGWVDAHDVRVRIALPRPLRAIDGSIVVDGVPVAARGARRGGSDSPFARVERSGGAHVLVVPVAARGAARITLRATMPSGYAGGTIVVSAGSHEAVVDFAPEPARDVRMRLIDVPRYVAPGEEIRMAAEVVNGGDVAEELFFCATGQGIVVEPEAVVRTIAPGSVAVVELVARANLAAPNDVRLVLSVVACDSVGERARTDLAVAVRERLAPCDDEPVEFDGVMPANVQAALRGPDAVQAGAPFTVLADIDVEDFVDMLAVRVRDVAGAAYVPGSTVLGGRAVLDRAGCSPLAGDGLLLRGVRAGTRVTAAWTLLADPSACDEALVVEATLGVDGLEQPCDSIAVHVRGRDAFTARPAGLPYHVEACIIDAPAPVVTPDTSGEAQPIEEFDPGARDDAFTFELRLNAARFDEVARQLAADERGLVKHILALRMLLPHGETSSEAGVAGALDGVRFAFGDVLDRLFVKLRIPGFAVASDDVDDVVLRSAMIGLFEKLLDASPGGDRCDGASARITRERLRELLAAFADAPFGSPAMLRALVALVPAHCDLDPALGTALARYAIALDDALARYEGAPLELFDDALARASDRALDDAAAALTVALHGYAAFAGTAC